MWQCRLWLLTARSVPATLLHSRLGRSLSQQKRALLLCTIFRIRRRTSGSFPSCSFLRGAPWEPYTLWPLPTICCDFSLVVSCLGFFPFALNLLFSRQWPSGVTFYCIWLEITEGLLQPKLNSRVLPWHLKYSQPFPSLSMLYWASKNDYKGSKAYSQQIRQVTSVAAKWARSALDRLIKWTASTAGVPKCRAVTRSPRPSVRSWFPYVFSLTRRCPEPPAAFLDLGHGASYDV